MANKTALITGITGQDGAFLARLLLTKGYRVVGTSRRAQAVNTWRLQELDILGDVEIVSMELSEDSNVRAVLEGIKPDEVYNLAAQSFVGDTFSQPIYTSQVNGIGSLRLLECIRTVAPETRFYQASSSEMFGKAEQVPQSEKTPFHPCSPYGTAKLFAHLTVINYRETYGLHCCSGILFNHDSPLRGIEFLTRKVTHGLARYSRRGEGPLRLGNLDAQRDWGHAREYVHAMWKMLQLSQPSDFVVATGKTHTVRDFIDRAAIICGICLDWTGQAADERAIDRATGNVVIAVDPAFYRPAEVDRLVGDASRAHRELDWRPATDLEQLVGEMVEADLRRVSSNHFIAI